MLFLLTEEGKVEFGGMDHCSFNNYMVIVAEVQSDIDCLTEIFLNGATASVSVSSYFLS